MNTFPAAGRIAIVRITGSAAIIATAFAAGSWMSRRMNASPSASMESKAPTALKVDLPIPAGDPVMRLSEADLANAKSVLGTVSTSRSPMHDVLTVCEKLLKSARTNEDFLRLVSFFNEADQPGLLEPVISAAFARWAQVNPAAAAGGINVLKYMHLRLKLADDLFHDWAGRDAEAALAFLETAPPGAVRREGPSAAFRALTEKDPEAAAKRALQWKVEVFPLSIMTSIFKEWVGQDADAAVAFARTEPDAGNRDRMLKALMQSLPPERAWQEALTLEDPEAGKENSFLRLALDRWGHRIEEPVSAVVALPPGAARDALLEAAADHAAVNGLERGEALLATMPDQELREQWLGGLAKGAAKDRPADAIALALQLPEGDNQTRLVMKTGGSWAGRDAPAASQWLSEQPPGPLRDAFTGEFVRGTFASDPSASLTWTAAIADDTLRQARLSELFPMWQQRDPAAASQWLEQAVISKEERRKLAANQ